jgi:hypothetical protein
MTTQAAGLLVAQALSMVANTPSRLPTNPANRILTLSNTQIAA